MRKQFWRMFACLLTGRNAVRPHQPHRCEPNKHMHTPLSSGGGRQACMPNPTNAPDSTDTSTNMHTKGQRRHRRSGPPSAYTNTHLRTQCATLMMGRTNVRPPVLTALRPVCEGVRLQATRMIIQRETSNVAHTIYRH